MKMKKLRIHWRLPGGGSKHYQFAGRQSGNCFCSGDACGPAG